MYTLHELAIRLQDFIVKQQQDAHSTGTLIVSKYNNLKLKMSSMYPFPHVIISIGISEAIYDIKEIIKIDGGLGPDERFVRKWLMNSANAFDLNQIYRIFDKIVEVKIKENKRDQATYSQSAEAPEYKKEPLNQLTYWEKNAIYEQKKKEMQEHQQQEIEITSNFINDVNSYDKEIKEEEIQKNKKHKKNIQSLLKSSYKRKNKN
ncbi:hypothetical protein J6G99_06355 [bacterium]|nr:hypothetical protein [bacterium]